MALKISNKKLKELIVKHHGIVKKICESAQISRQSFYDRIKKHDDMKECLENAREMTIDVAESKLIKLIEEGHYPSIRFYLETQAKHKGYTIKQEVSNTHTIQNILEVPEMQTYEPDIDEIREH
jgi:predicted DNA-binding protein YlxM (UPF0122 family)|tara:strand:- start:1330 stop:1701 length:372 start_codon:yes stop_codon:yes gene_type:complete